MAVDLGETISFVSDYVGSLPSALKAGDVFAVSILLICIYPAVLFINVHLISYNIS